MHKGYMVLLNVVVFLLLSCSQSLAQSTLDIDKKREEERRKLGSILPKQDQVRQNAKMIFSKPLSEQSEEELRSIAKRSNIYANLVNYILKGYNDYYRESYRYDFVLKRVAGPKNEYEKIKNEFLGIRNQAYFNLGLKAKSAGKPFEALLNFRDAFRLTYFDCGKKQPKEKCMRWKAEQELQKMLGLSSIRAYVTW